jgi:hypothetical protein
MNRVSAHEGSQMMEASCDGRAGIEREEYERSVTQMTERV